MKLGQRLIVAFKSINEYAQKRKKSNILDNEISQLTLRSTLYYRNRVCKQT